MDQNLEEKLKKLEELKKALYKKQKKLQKFETLMKTEEHVKKTVEQLRNVPGSPAPVEVAPSEQQSEPTKHVLTKDGLVNTVFHSDNTKEATRIDTNVDAIRVAKVRFEKRDDVSNTTEGNEVVIVDNTPTLKGLEFAKYSLVKGSPIVETSFVKGSPCLTAVHNESLVKNDHYIVIGTKSGVAKPTLKCEVNNITQKSMKSPSPHKLPSVNKASSFSSGAKTERLTPLKRDPSPIRKPSDTNDDLSPKRYLLDSEPDLMLETSVIIEPAASRSEPSESILKDNSAVTKKHSGERDIKQGGKNVGISPFSQDLPGDQNAAFIILDSQSQACENDGDSQENEMDATPECLMDSVLNDSSNSQSILGNRSKPETKAKCRKPQNSRSECSFKKTQYYCSPLKRKFKTSNITSPVNTSPKQRGHNVKKVTKQKSSSCPTSPPKDSQPIKGKRKRKTRHSELNLLDFSFLDEDHDMYSQIKGRRRQRQRVIESNNQQRARSLPGSYIHPQPICLPSLDAGLSQPDYTAKIGQSQNCSVKTQTVAQLCNEVKDKQLKTEDFVSEQFSEDIFASQNCNNSVIKCGNTDDHNTPHSKLELDNSESTEDTAFSFPEFPHEKNENKVFQLPSDEFVLHALPKDPSEMPFFGEKNRGITTKDSRKATSEAVMSEENIAEIHKSISSQNQPNIATVQQEATAKKYCNSHMTDVIIASVACEDTGPENLSSREQANSFSQNCAVSQCSASQSGCGSSNIASSPPLRRLSSSRGRRKLKAKTKEDDSESLLLQSTNDSEMSTWDDTLTSDTLMENQAHSARQQHEVNDGPVESYNGERLPQQTEVKAKDTGHVLINDVTVEVYATVTRDKLEIRDLEDKTMLCSAEVETDEEFENVMCIQLHTSDSLLMVTQATSAVGATINAVVFAGEQISDMAIQTITYSDPAKERVLIGKGEAHLSVAHVTAECSTVVHDYTFSLLQNAEDNIVNEPVLVYMVRLEKLPYTALLSLYTLETTPDAVIGVSARCLHLWDRRSGALLTEIDLAVSCVRCIAVRELEGLLFLDVYLCEGDCPQNAANSNSTSLVKSGAQGRRCLIAVNPVTSRTVLVNTEPQYQQYRGGYNHDLKFHGRSDYRARPYRRG